VNCCVVPATTVAADGLMEIVKVGGLRVMSPNACVPSTAVAVTVTVCFAVMGFGAVYVTVVRPVASGPVCVPTLAPVTVGLNVMVAVAGETPVTRTVTVQVPPPLKLHVVEPLPADVPTVTNV
jgi:hypothetical protein